jgi:flagellar L-ring protein precursor FlgH
MFDTMPSHAATAGSEQAAERKVPCRGCIRYAKAFRVFSVASALSACLATQIAAGPIAPPPVTPSASPSPSPTYSSPPAARQVTGSLWGESSGSLFKDLKARQVGDIVTITVSEDSKGSKAATTETSRTKDFSGSLKFAGTSAGTAPPVGAFSFGPYQGQFENKSAGDGTTTRTDSMSAYMTATVVEVLPNGNMFIRGSRWTKVNNDMQQIILEGVIRPNDITRNNTVLSQNIAEAKIFLVGKGPIAQHQKPGWLGQLWDLISPF